MPSAYIQDYSFRSVLHVVVSPISIRIRRPWAVYPLVLTLAGCDAVADLSQFDEARLSTPPVGEVDAGRADGSTHADDAGHADGAVRAIDAAYEAAADATSVVDSAAVVVDAAPDVLLEATADAAPVVDAMAMEAAPPPPPTGTVVVDPTTVYQTIDGFGASDVFLSSITSQQMRLFYDPAEGIGLSILRVGIDTDGEGLGTALLSDIATAASYGAIVWGAPWSPPGTEKTNGNEDNGGYLCTAADAGSCAGDSSDAWASTLASFPGWVYSQTGVSVYAISPQNEPDWTASYASCLYTGQELANFAKVLAPKLAALNPPVKVIAGEPASWANLWTGDGTCASANDYGACIHADPVAEAAVDILATHDYGFAPVAPPAWNIHRIWETEVSGVSGSSQVGPSVDIGNGVAVATWIHNALVVGQVSAWHYWWLVSSSATDNEGLLFPTGQGPGGLGDINSPPKRLYAMGNYSKFVRPGFQRIAATGTNAAGIDISAFQNPADSTIVVVAINTTSAPISLTFTTPGTANATTAMTPWVTSAASNLVAGSPIPVTDGSFVGTMEGESVTTFVGSH
jgi:glucuronoarabinoxylan endo-1,4-beta-xylanase